MMKLTFILLMACVVQVSATIYSQSTKFTFNVKNERVVDILREIENQSEFRFFFQREQVDVERKIDLQVTDQTVEQILEQLFVEQEIDFQVRHDNLILLKPEGTNPENPNFWSQQQQQRTVSGKITDSGGQPLPGVTIVVKGTTQGTITNADGEYTLTNLPSDPTLVFSFVGMRTQEMVVGNQTTINVTMEEETIGIEEVVAIGYGTQKKVNLTGAVSQVSSDVLESRPVANVGQALQGQISNLNISQSSGDPGRGASFNIRGYTSITGGDPLILVDNIPMDINLINPQDIESISVLKDAASAAIYGARAAFGVILITTKSGKKSDEPTVSLSTNYSVNSPTWIFEGMNALERMQYMNTASQARSGKDYYQFDTDIEKQGVLAAMEDPNAPTATPDPNNPMLYLPHYNTNWKEWLLRDNYPQHQHTASISGGTDNFTYYSSLSYFYQEGMAKQFDEKYDRYNLVTNLSYDITDWATVGAKVSINTSNKYWPAQTERNELPENYIIYQSHQWANWPVYNPDGNYFNGGSVANMVQFMREAGYQERDKMDMWITGNAILTPVDNVTINIDYSYNSENTQYISYWKKLKMYYTDGSIQGYYPYTNPPQVTRQNNNNNYYAFNAYANYENSFGKHNVKGMVGFNQENARYTNFRAKRENLIIETIPYMDLAYGEKYVGDGASEFAIRGAFTRFNYDFDNRYFFEFNGRYDGSSKFPKDDRFEFFPSASVGWRIENDFTGLKSTFDMLKLRLSYGNLGNQDVRGYYPYIASFNAGAVNYLIGSEQPMTVYAPGLVSPTLTWETVTQYDIGVDFAILNNRLNTSFDIYRRDTKNMLTRSRTLPAVLAVSEPNENAADLETGGWDLTIEWKDRVSDLNYGFTFLLSDYTSEITKFDNPKGLISDYYVGRDLGEIWGFETGGIFQTDEEAKALDQTNISGRERLAGDLWFKDLDGDGKITYGESTLDDPGDRKIIGNSTPRYSYGFKTTMEWKGFDLLVFLQGIGKRDRRLSNTYWLGGYTSEWTVHNKLLTDWWSPENTDAHFPRPLITGGYDVTTTQTRYLQNAAYMRLKQLTLGYTIPRHLTQKVMVDRIRVYFTGNNALDIINKMYKDVTDPEMDNAKDYPIYRSYSVGANIYF